MNNIKSHWLPLSQKKVDRYLLLIRNRKYYDALLLLHSTKSNKIKMILYKLLLNLYNSTGTQDFNIQCWSGRGKYFPRAAFYNATRTRISQKKSNKGVMGGIGCKINNKPHVRVFLKALNINGK